MWPFRRSAPRLRLHASTDRALSRQDLGSPARPNRSVRRGSCSRARGAQGQARREYGRRRGARAGSSPQATDAICGLRIRGDRQSKRPRGRSHLLGALQRRPRSARRPPFLCAERRRSEASRPGLREARAFGSSRGAHPESRPHHRRSGGRRRDRAGSHRRGNPIPGSGPAAGVMISPQRGTGTNGEVSPGLHITPLTGAIDHSSGIMPQLDNAHRSAKHPVAQLRLRAPVSDVRPHAPSHERRPLLPRRR